VAAISRIAGYLAVPGWAAAGAAGGAVEVAPGKLTTGADWAAALFSCTLNTPPGQVLLLGSSPLGVAAAPNASGLLTVAQLTVAAPAGVAPTLVQLGGINLNHFTEEYLMQVKPALWMAMIETAEIVAQLNAEHCEKCVAELVALRGRGGLTRLGVSRWRGLGGVMPSRRQTGRSLRPRLWRASGGRASSRAWVSGVLRRCSSWQK
jgi:acetyl-CoA C-acetyltransferase